MAVRKASCVRKRSGCKEKEWHRVGLDKSDRMKS